ncbi:helix-turn-helix transcriptional regulator [filamentous cyanobacterium LEGE 11480]|uniref:Helix-turn-helix transcriptional regulator n=1 Tax=Romeriopsis navalis LEGE 11480 TaxID=2777977 RepID=A0A928Z7M7_9CYAN|nr:PadR family transcriptional regulator [Romeriopsis navalis]MBE9033305.1 helix-turn-helix transcriptional regulator [Romeriopsis navalis LEGE 11480]
MKQNPLDITPREEIVLLALRRKSSYGAELTYELQQVSDFEIDFGCGTLYPILHRLEKQNLLRRCSVKDLKGTRGGRPKKYYEITEEGRAILESIQQFRMRLQAWTDDNGWQPSY